MTTAKQADKGNGEGTLHRVLGADPDKPIEVITHNQTQARLGALLAGKEEPKTEIVAYLVEQLRASNVEFRQAQAAIQELNQRLGQLQQRAIQLQGEQQKYSRDIIEWMDRDMNKPTGDEKPGEKDNA